jgi:hypothetical protein
MTIKKWCGIKKAIEMIATAQSTSVGRAQAWLIEACATGNIRSREPSTDPLTNDDLSEMDVRSGVRVGTVFRKQAPAPISQATWKRALIDANVLLDAGQGGRWRGVEISIADLEFELKQSPSSESMAPAPMPKPGGRPSDKGQVEAEAERRLTTKGEKKPPNLAAFSRDLHDWLDSQPWARRGIQSQKVLSPASIEEQIRPLWRKYRGD